MDKKHIRDKDQKKRTNVQQREAQRGGNKGKVVREKKIPVCEKHVVSQWNMKGHPAPIFSRILKNIQGCQTTMVIGNWSQIGGDSDCFQ